MVTPATLLPGTGGWPHASGTTPATGRPGRPYTAAAIRKLVIRMATENPDTRRPEPINLAEHRIRRKQVLGGLTHEYYVAA
ncbi:MAG: hypothetical protein ABSB76_08990 [Streptosporangiaceae bacterium]|jgi:urease alpha subunit